MLLRNEDADVTLARVAIPGGPGAEEIEEYLKALASSLESKGASVDTAILKGDPAAEIVRRAIEGGFHLIAMCSRGKTGLKRLILGSVAEAVLRRSTVPVLIVHPTEKSADAPKIRRIVVPLDGTHRAAGILASVADLAGAAGAKIGFVSVVSPTKREELPVEVVAENIFREQKKLQKRGLDVELAILYGDPALETVGFAERNQADLVALATHGRSGLDRIRHGSVAETILRSTRIPLLVVRTKAAVKPPLRPRLGLRRRARTPEVAARAR
jgi:nucleotide-binding universal stress UspA family protein